MHSSYLVEEEIDISGVSEHTLQLRAHSLQLLLDGLVLTVPEGEGHHQSVFEGAVPPELGDLSVDGEFLGGVSDVAPNSQHHRRGTRHRQPAPL